MKLKLFWVTFIVFISSANGDKDGLHELHTPEANDLMEMIAISSPEISQGYEDAPRKPESEISSEPSDVRFYLYSNPNNASEYQEVFYNWNLKIKELKVHPSAPWKILIHGFRQNKDSAFPRLLVTEYLKRWKKTGQRYNILVVDWGKLAYSVQRTWRILSIYSKAVQNVNVAGQRVGDMITWLKRMPLSDKSWKVSDPNNYAINDLSKVHIIGFSLGAHVAGKAGQVVLNQFSRRVGRITGLDPAGPSFFQGAKNPGRKLQAKDANAMDIIHTAAKSFGIGEEIGDADFYPNAGYAPWQTQPWCLRNKYWTPLVCSHNLAPVFFAFSINHHTPTEACQCGSWVSYRTICSCRNKGFMGEDWQTSQIGLYYLELSSDEVDRRMNNMGHVMRQSPKNVTDSNQGLTSQFSDEKII